ncbi:MAG: caspase family protein [Rhodopseudomonas sp.]|uniref:caspase family protein n=1 Tax=Rhodopseudomonas sp. TaxID=1078 RepID=UPI0017D30B3E|nr:caspase family protein [Rhodopseudomonas sp.]NVN87889.1 caspase family protein [Rhodopseudomonas sp.]
MFRPIPRNLLSAAGFLLSFQVAASDAVFAESRVALVIGQSAYRAVVALPNPANDAKKMTELLGNAGFEVTEAPDLSQNDMRQAVSNFAAKVAASGPDTVALVFYAGHGLQIDGENYLLPVDVDPKREADIPLQAVRLNDLMNTLGAVPTRMRIVMLDACRNNPFPDINMTAGHGLAIVDTKAGAAGSFISYSTSPGAVAEDGNGTNSPYTTALLNVAKEPNLPIEEAFKRVRIAVNQATDGRQIPWESSSLTTEFKFFSGGQGSGQGPSGQGEKAEPRKPPSAARSLDDWRKELKGKDPQVAYELVIADDSVTAYEAFVALFAQPPFNTRVRSLLDRRKVMEAWSTAVAINTAASFQTFLASYPDSDLAATARKMQERVRNRSFGTPAVQPTNVALGPMCPCPVQPLKRKVEEPARPKRVEAPRVRKPPVEKEVVERPHPAGSGIPPEVIMQGIGLGIGIAGGLSHGGGGGGGPVPHSEGHRH